MRHFAEQSYTNILVQYERMLTEKIKRIAKNPTTSNHCSMSVLFLFLETKNENKTIITIITRITFNFERTNMCMLNRQNVDKVIEMVI